MTPLYKGWSAVGPIDAAMLQKSIGLAFDRWAARF